jgi:hypothetical protein
LPTEPLYIVAEPTDNRWVTHLRLPRYNSANTTVGFGRFSQAVFVFLALCAVITVVGSKDAADAAGALGVLVGLGLAGGLFIARARTLEGRERVGWSLIGLGVGVAAFGVLVVGAVFFMQGEAPAFGWTVWFCLAA